MKGLLGQELWRLLAAAKKKKSAQLSEALSRPHPGRRKGPGGTGTSKETWGDRALSEWSSSAEVKPQSQ